MLKIKWPLMSPEGDGNDTSGGGGGDGDQGGKDDKGGGKGDAGAEARMEALEKAVSLIASGSQATNEGISALVAKIEGMASGNSRGDKGGDKGESKDDDEDVDLETMDRKQFANHLLGKLKGTVEGALQPLSERFGQLDEKIDGHTLGTTIKEFTKDHPDFFEWKDEIRALVKENPTLKPARLYTLARAENSEKAKRIDEKYGLNKVSQDKGSEDKILSLFPRAGSSTTKSGTGKMSPKQAAAAAWDEVMSKLG